MWLLPGLLRLDAVGWLLRRIYWSPSCLRSTPAAHCRLLQRGRLIAATLRIRLLRQHVSGSAGGSPRQRVSRSAGGNSQRRISARLLLLPVGWQLTISWRLPVGWRVGAAGWRLPIGGRRRVGAVWGAIGGRGAIAAVGLRRAGRTEAQNLCWRAAAD